MLEILYPDAWVASTYKIPFEKLYKKGYRGVIFDIDNTLVPHGAPADERAEALFEHLKELGFSYALISNNKGPRVQMFNTFCRRSDFYRCFGRKACWNLQYSGTANPSEGRNPDRVQT